MQKKCQALMSKVDANVTMLAQRFQSILELASSEDKSLNTSATETLQIETNTANIIRIAEELLMITRQLKEAWVLGQIPVMYQQFDDKDLAKKMDKLLDDITR